MGTFHVIMLLAPQLCFSALSIDRYKIETNHTVGTIDFKYINNEKGMAIMNFSVHTFVTITKAMLYFRVDIIIKKDGRAYAQEFMKTRIDAEKLLSGLYGNFLMKSFMDNVLGDIRALNFSIPLPPVSTSNGISYKV